MAYIHHPHHRSAEYATQKSQWSILPAAEKSCFEIASTANWGGERCYWSLHLVAAKPAVLGTSPTPNNHALHIAKFVGDENGDWHGYPVAPWLSTKDRPTTEVLENWLENKFIGRPSFGKLKRGKKCAL